MIKMDKKYKYANGGNARILCVDAPGEYPVRSITDFGAVISHHASGTVPWYNDASWGLVEVSPWDDFKDGDPVMVRDLDGYWHRRHFARHAGENVFCYEGGRTKWTSEGRLTSWLFCRRPTEEEL